MKTWIELLVSQSKGGIVYLKFRWYKLWFVWTYNLYNMLPALTPLISASNVGFERFMTSILLELQENIQNFSSHKKTELLYQVLWFSELKSTLLFHLNLSECWQDDGWLNMALVAFILWLCLHLTHVKIWWIPISIFTTDYGNSCRNFITWIFFSLSV